jgi:hypothetical protein
LALKWWIFIKAHLGLPWARKLLRSPGEDVRVPSSPLVLRCLLLVAASLLASCAAPAAGEDDEEISGSEEDFTGANRMGLRLAYDEASSHVRATVKRKLRAGETLRLRVRRGRLTPQSPNELDCALLVDAPALPQQAGATTVTYGGPELEQSLLASVYDEEWVLANLSPQALDRVAREGADSIAEACVVKGNTVRARMVSSLRDAWDQTDPHASYAVRNR